MDEKAAKMVLVTEDNEDLRSLVKMLLEDEGFTVRTAEHGREALQRVEERMPDLILLDMKMPVMDGWEFAEELRRRYGDAIPIVVMTAADHAASRAQEIHATSWLSKPFEPDELVRKVREHVGA